MKFIIKIFSVFLLFFLVACGDSTRKKMGIINTPPDEFQVYKRKDLSVPPNFELRVPDSSSAQNEINNEEKNLLFSDNEKEELSINDEILLMTVGKNEVDVNIREVIDDENALKEIEKSTLDKILDFDPVFEGEEKENVINAEEEKRRLKALKNEMEGIEAELIEVEKKKKEDDENFDQTTLHSIATSDDEKKRPKNDKNVKNNNNIKNEEKSFLDDILDFDLFGSDEEDEEAKNQRDNTFWNKEKGNNTNQENNENLEQISVDDEDKTKTINDNNLIDEEESFLDDILDFDLFGSDEEDEEAKNQRDSTFWNKEKEKDKE